MVRDHGVSHIRSAGIFQGSLSRGRKTPAIKGANFVGLSALSVALRQAHQAI